MVEFNHVLSGDELFNVESYVESVTRLAENKSDLIFTSSNAINAAIVMATLMKVATSEVRIYDDSINGDIADQHQYFLNTLGHFFLQGKKLKIVVRNDSDNDSKIQNALEGYSDIYGDSFEIRIASKEFRDNIRGAVKKDINFLVNDVNGFRMEIIQNPNDNIREAYCCFNKRDLTEKLTVIFDEKFETCERFQFPAHA